jgi:exopolyphosphatase/pppGpp-phosphohydrolase
MPDMTTHLRFAPGQTTLAVDSADAVVLTVGVRTIADGMFRHDPPTSFEVEQAIDVVEDALTSSRLPHRQRGDLVTDEPLLRAWFPVNDSQDVERRLSRDEVEATFDRLAAASQGQPGALAGLPTDRSAAAALLILRECMHHLGFDGIRMRPQ